MTKVTGNWVRDNYWNILVTTLLGIIAFFIVRDYNRNETFQKEQLQLNTEIVKAVVKLQEQNETDRAMIILNSDVNTDQGRELIQHGEQIVENKTNIRSLINTLRR